MTLLHHTRLVLRLAWAAILWGGATIGGALVAALSGSYSLIALHVRDRLEAL